MVKYRRGDREAAPSKGNVANIVCTSVMPKVASSRRSVASAASTQVPSKRSVSKAAPTTSVLKAIRSKVALASGVLQSRRKLRLDWVSKVAAAKAREPASIDAATQLSYLHSLHFTSRLPQSGPRVALATCSKGCPANRLQEWLFWHLSIGISLIMIRLEGELDKAQEEVLRGPQERGEVIIARKHRLSQSSGFSSVMGRQVAFTHGSIKQARELGFDFLLHLDDDEILYPIRSEDSIQDVLRQHTGKGVRCIHFENYEAVFPYEETTQRPFSRSSIRFRNADQTLYINGKSAANLTAKGDVFCSGVHHFCQFDRTFEEASPEFGLHDEGSGCTHPECCSPESGALVLHFDSPSFAEWRCKFAARAASRFIEADKEEMDAFPFKKESVAVLRQDYRNKEAEEAVYRRWRCLPGRRREHFDIKITGESVAARFRLYMEQAAKQAQRGTA